MSMSCATIFCVLAISFATIYIVHGGVISQRDPRTFHTQNTAENKVEVKKRPFCNAFTGCGRKRSSPSGPLLSPIGSRLSDDEQTEGNYFDDNLATLLDLNSEPAVEDLMRQIMSEAKLWEAIQEASREIHLHKNGRSMSNNQFPVAFSAQ
ncbi:cardioactive peptide [Lutzomyia longipalpis]|uniref:Putative conserved secreted protein n=1 Tax=Lutzomyia longipalpis TaxID=7200 RepID=A0A1B0CFK9_LUTLO|nr:cardioactive peptide [Lutzomyia longipalpis]